MCLSILYGFFPVTSQLLRAFVFFFSTPLILLLLLDLCHELDFLHLLNYLVLLLLQLQLLLLLLLLLGTL